MHDKLNRGNVDALGPGSNKLNRGWDDEYMQGYMSALLIRIRYESKWWEDRAEGRYRTNLLTLGVFVGHSRGIEGSTHRHPIVRVLGLDVDLLTRGRAAQLL